MGVGEGSGTRVKMNLNTSMWNIMAPKVPWVSNRVGWHRTGWPRHGSSAPGESYTPKREVPWVAVSLLVTLLSSGADGGTNPALTHPAMRLVPVVAVALSAPQHTHPSRVGPASPTTPTPLNSTHASTHPCSKRCSRCHKW